MLFKDTLSRMQHHQHFEEQVTHCHDKLDEWNLKTPDVHHVYPVRLTCYLIMDQKNFLKSQSCNYKTHNKMCLKPVDFFLLKLFSIFFFYLKQTEKKLESQDSQLILIHNSVTLTSFIPDYMLSIRCHGDLTRLGYLWYPAKTLTTTPEIWLRCSLCFLLLHLMNSSWNILSSKPFHRAPVSHSPLFSNTESSSSSWLTGCQLKISPDALLQNVTHSD